MNFLKTLPLAVTAIVLGSGTAYADTITFAFNCQMTPTNPGGCVSGGSYGTLTLTDSAVDPNRVDIDLIALAQPGYGDTLERFYLNFANPFLTNHQFYLVRQDAPVGSTSNLLGSVQYSNSNFTFSQFKFDLISNPENASLTFSGSLSLYNQLPAIDTPVNIDVADFLFTTSGAGTPPLYAAYRTHNTAAGPEFWAGSTQIATVPEPSSVLLLGSVLLGFGVALKRLSPGRR